MTKLWRMQTYEMLESYAQIVTTPPPTWSGVMEAMVCIAAGTQGNRTWRRDAQDEAASHVADSTSNYSTFQAYQLPTLY